MNSVMIGTPKYLDDRKNIGAKYERTLVRVGIETPQQLQATDPFNLYAQLRWHVPGTSLVALYALIGALENRHRCLPNEH